MVALTIAVRSAAADRAKPGDVNEARVLSETSSGVNWLVGGGTFDEQHFSPLTQITDKDIDNLGFAWALDIDSAMGLSVEPIVVDGVIYVSAPRSRVYAVDAVSGKSLWIFDAKVRLDRMRNSWAARTNRGVAAPRFQAGRQEECAGRARHRAAGTPATGAAFQQRNNRDGPRPVREALLL